MKFRTEKVLRDKIKVVVSSPRNLSYSKEKKLRYRRGEVMLHRVEIRRVLRMLQKQIEKELEKLSGHPAGSSPGVGSGLWIFLVLFPDGDSEKLVNDII